MVDGRVADVPIVHALVEAMEVTAGLHAERASNSIARAVRTVVTIDSEVGDTAAFRSERGCEESVLQACRVVDILHVT